MVQTTSSSAGLVWDGPLRPNGQIVEYQLWVIGLFEAASVAGMPKVAASVLLAEANRQPLATTTALPSTAAATRLLTTLPQATASGPERTGPIVNLLSPNITQGDALRNSNGSVSFDGATSLRLTDQGPLLGSFFTLYFEVLQTSASGYIFAKASRTGVHTFSVFPVATAAQLFLLYKYGSNQAGQIVFGDVNLRDGKLHRVMLSVRNATVELRVDDKPVQSKLLAGPILDCGAAATDCIVDLGQKPSLSGAHARWAGTLAQAALFPRVALSTYPDVGLFPADGLAAETSTSAPATTSAPQQTASSPANTMTSPTALPVQVLPAAPDLASADAVLVFNGTLREATVVGLRPFSAFLALVRAVNSVGSALSLSSSGRTQQALASDLPAPTATDRTAVSFVVRWLPPAQLNGVFAAYRVGVGLSSQACRPRR